MWMEVELMRAEPNRFEIWEVGGEGVDPFRLQRAVGFQCYIRT